MQSPYVVRVAGLDPELFANEEAKSLQAASRAVNKIARDGRAEASRQIRTQVSFKAHYLTGGSDPKLKITQAATTGDLQAVITGRHRATSLAHFSTGEPPAKAGQRPRTKTGKLRKTKPVRLMVKPGRRSTIKSAFLIRLRAGRADIDTRSNLGLALRLKPGETVRHKHVMKRMKGGLYLLYGPSVAQVFATVATDVAPDLAQKLQAEYLRLRKLDDR